VRVHILTPPHTIPIWREGTCCAFTQRTLLAAHALYHQGCEVLVYGTEGGDHHEVADEFVEVLDRDAYEVGWGHRSPDQPVTGADVSVEHPIARLWNKRAQRALALRVEPGDIVGVSFGIGHQGAIEGTRGMPIEIGIGYNNPFLQRRIYESQAWLHFHLGREGHFGGCPDWQVVRTGCYAPDFDATLEREDYALFIGRLNPDKGLAQAVEATRVMGLPLKLAGPGDPNPWLMDHVEYLGVLDRAARREALGRARVVLVPTQYVEPLGNVHLEALMSGTPVITSDHGVFTETVLPGFNGWRCRTQGEYHQALDRLDRLASSEAIRSWAEEAFSVERFGRDYVRAFEIFQGNR
jgi:glycosyltransferase involved in cell wall biosynthesis